MAKFEVRRKFDALGGGYIAVGNKDHVCYRTPRKEGATHELADKIYATVLICYRHDDTDRNEEDCTDREC